MSNIANNVVYVLAYDYNDCDDEVFAFANANCASAFATALAATYKNTHYAACANIASIVLDEERFAFFAAHYGLAENVIDCFDCDLTAGEDALFSWMYAQHAAKTVKETVNFDDAFDEYLDAMLG